jgi:hypothetical protein
LVKKGVQKGGRKIRRRSFEKTEVDGEAWLLDDPMKVETLKEDGKVVVVSWGNEAVIIFTIFSDCLKQNI